MTRKEAIKRLKICAPSFYSIHNGEEDRIAIDMAIKTLQHEQERLEDIYECPNCIGEVHKNYMYCPFCGIKVGEGW